jgi:hypothetical protein
MENKIIEGTINFKIEIKENEYDFEFSERTAENELLSLMVAREIFKFLKNNLKESKKQAKGADLQMVKDRLNKVTSGEYILGVSIEQTIAAILSNVPEVADETKVETELKTE